MANRGLAAVVVDFRDDNKIRRAENRPVDEEEDRSMVVVTEAVRLEYEQSLLSSFVSMD